MAGLLQGLLDLLIPPLCAGCANALDREGDALRHVLCASCRDELRFLPRDGCRLCQEVVPPNHAGALPADLCGRCTQEGSVLSACLASVAYEGSAEDWIHRFKYPPRGLAGLQPGPESVVNALARDAAGRSSAGAPDLVIPIPLHPERLRERGFNPAASLAWHLYQCSLRAAARGRSSDRPAVRLAPGLLARVRDTPSQTHLSRSQRQRNVRGAFCCPAPQALQPHVWLIDDVVTTGSTLNEAARTLKRSGVEKVEAICAARALRHT